MAKAKAFHATVKPAKESLEGLSSLPVTPKTSRWHPKN